MEGKVIKSKLLPNGMLLQIVKAEACGGRYYLVVDGEPGFHSLNLERVENYMNSWLH